MRDQYDFSQGIRGKYAGTPDEWAWYQIDVGYACGGVAVNARDVVVVAAPIFKWMERKPWAQVCEWIARRNGVATPCR